MKRIRNYSVFVLMTLFLLIYLIPTEADAAGNSASAFRLDKNVLVEYLGNDKEVLIPSNVEAIGEGAFENNETIEKVTIPSGVKQIDAYAFWGCSNLKTVIGCEGLSAYDDFSFANCAALESIPIPSNIEQIGIMAFADDKSLSSLYIPYTVSRIHDSAFDGCSNLELTVVKGSEGERYSTVFEAKKQEMKEYEQMYKVNDTKPSNPAAEKEEESIVPNENQNIPQQGENASESQKLPQDHETVEEQEPVKNDTSSVQNSQKEDPNAKVLGSSVVVAHMAVVFLDENDIHSEETSNTERSETGFFNQTKEIQILVNNYLDDIKQNNYFDNILQR